MGSEPLPERPADILKIWLDREPVQRLRPDESNPMLDERWQRNAVDDRFRNEKAPLVGGFANRTERTLSDVDGGLVGPTTTVPAGFGSFSVHAKLRVSAHKNTRVGPGHTAARRD